MDAKRIRPVGRDLHINHRVIETKGCHRRGSHRPVAADFNDAVMLLADQKLTLRTHHALAFGATDHAEFQCFTTGRDDRTWQRDNRLHAGAGVRRSTHHLDNARIGFNPAQPQLVGIGMLGGFNDVSHLEGGQQPGLVVNLLHFETNADQAIDDLFQRGGCVEIFLEPGEGEFHDCFFRIFFLFGDAIGADLNQKNLCCSFGKPSSSRRLSRRSTSRSVVSDV